MNQEKRMVVKGTGPAALNAFVKETFQDRYEEWLAALPEASQKIYRETILTVDDYLIYDALVQPMETICELFYNGNEKGAWDAGIHSASFALKGFYKIFFKFGSPQFIIDRASRLFSNYYPEGALLVKESSYNPDRLVLHIIRFPEPYRMIEVTTGGWMDGVLQLLDKNNIIINITQYMSNGDPVTEYKLSWT